MPSDIANNKLPEILNIKTVTKSRLFHVEALDLKFSNGEARTFERLKAGSFKAVMICAINNNKQLILIKEYAAGLERYDLGFPKGIVDPGESITQAANRELQEEAGFGAENLEHIGSINLAPNYMTHCTELVLATNLFVNKLEGDEPEPLEVVLLDFAQIDDYIINNKIQEARTIAMLYLVKQHLNNNAI